jgi:hypothetical protein
METLQAFGALFQIPQYYRKFLYYESREEMLNEDGRGIEWMKNVEWRRRTICGEG